MRILFTQIVRVLFVIALLLALAKFFSSPAAAGEFDHCLKSPFGHFGGTYETTRMLDKYTEVDAKIRAKYFTKEEREKARLQVIGGKFYDSEGRVASYAGERIYVMDSSGGFYQIPNTLGNFHSTVFSGGPVSGAGTVIFLDGVLLSISNSSGHYAPSPEYLMQTLEALYRRSVDLSKAQVSVMRAVEGAGGRVVLSEVKDAESFLFGDREAVLCVGKRLAEPGHATADGFRLFAKLDPQGMTELIAKIEREGEIARYVPVFSEFFKNHPKYFFSMSEKGRAEFLEVRRRERCVGAVSSALQSISHSRR
jgi:hypothetical protein